MAHNTVSEMDKRFVKYTENNNKKIVNNNEFKCLFLLSNRPMRYTLHFDRKSCCYANQAGLLQQEDVIQMIRNCSSGNQDKKYIRKCMTKSRPFSPLMIARLILKLCQVCMDPSDSALTSLLGNRFHTSPLSVEGVS